MAAVTDNGQAHALIVAVVSHQLLELLGQGLEFRLRSEARLEELGLHLDLV